MPPTVQPALVKGFRDVLPGEMLLRNRIVAAARAVFERYGFSPLETPAVERLDVLLGPYGEASSKEMFRLETPDQEPVGLRFDLTVPLARVVAQYPELPRPFRRYQVSSAWRYDKPGPGRFREFLQFDIDTVGSAEVAADVEVVAAALEVLDALGLERSRMRLSSRRLLNHAIAWAGLAPERAADVLRVLDKLDRIGPDAVRLELTAGRVDASGDRIPGLGFAGAAVDRMLGLVVLRGPTRAATLELAAARLGGESAAVLAELGAIDRQLAALGIGSERAWVDLSLARGLAYYTGPIFEAVLDDAPEFGSVFGGGRYDGLVARFGQDEVAATGGSLGVDRLLAAQIKLGRWTLQASATAVLVTVLDPGLMTEYQAMAGDLRRAGIATEVYLGGQRGLKKQLAHADRIGARAAVLLGGDELARGEVTIKDLVAGAQQGAGVAGRGEFLAARFGQRSVPRGELVAAVRECLARS